MNRAKSPMMPAARTLRRCCAARSGRRRAVGCEDVDPFEKLASPADVARTSKLADSLARCHAPISSNRLNPMASQTVQPDKPLIWTIASNDNARACAVRSAGATIDWVVRQPLVRSSLSLEIPAPCGTRSTLSTSTQAPRHLWHLGTQAPWHLRLLRSAQLRHPAERRAGDRVGSCRGGPRSARRRSRPQSPAASRRRCRGRSARERSRAARSATMPSSTSTS